jgi:hypothetical protein
MNETQTMSRKEIRQVFREHRGAAAELAAKLHVSKTTISLVLRGKNTSERILTAAREMAEGLLAKEIA